MSQGVSERLPYLNKGRGQTEFPKVLIGDAKRIQRVVMSLTKLVLAHRSP